MKEIIFMLCYIFVFISSANAEIIELDIPCRESVIYYDIDIDNPEIDTRFNTSRDACYLVKYSVLNLTKGTVLQKEIRRKNYLELESVQQGDKIEISIRNIMDTELFRIEMTVDKTIQKYIARNTLKYSSNKNSLFARGRNQEPEILHSPPLITNSLKDGMSMKISTKRHPDMGTLTFNKKKGLFIFSNPQMGVTNTEWQLEYIYHFKIQSLKLNFCIQVLDETQKSFKLVGMNSECNRIE